MYKWKIEQHSAPSILGWLKWYYFVRFAFSAAWVAVVFAFARDVPALAAVMLVGYPAWDAITNLADAERNGGLRRSKTQLLNVVVSTITAVAVAVALSDSMNSVLVVLGIWAGFAGIFQLAAALRRWRSSGAQWAMILSGGQSTLAGFFFVSMAGGPALVSIATVAPYAAFGAFYFLIAAVWLAVSDLRRGTLRTAS
jgi:uncharacterized membrane protein HdeD (DUF308 family)